MSSDRTIDSDLVLVLNSTSDPIHSNNGTFKISTVTSNATVTSRILSQPIASHLQFTAVTKNADVNATFAPTYEGPFTLVASNRGESAVEANKDAEDPRGVGLKRFVRMRTIIGSVVTGEVGWTAGDEFEDVSDEEWLDWELIDLVDAEEEGEGLTGGWGFMEKMKMDGGKVKREEGREARAPGSKISLVTSTGKNLLYFA